MAYTEEFKNSDTLVIAITGFGGKLNLPVTDFFPKAGLNDHDKVIIYDPERLAVLAGLPPEFAKFTDLLTHLEELIENNGYKTVLLTGTSGGGHTALLLGHLLKADKVVVFAPYPYLSIQEAARMKDPALRYLSIQEAARMKDPALRSFSRIVNKLDGLPPESKRYFDLKGILSNWNGKTEYFVHVARFNRTDFNRVSYLRGLPHFYFKHHPYAEHGIAGMLHKNSELKNCFIFPYQNRGLLKTAYLHIKLPFRSFMQATEKLLRKVKRRIKNLTGTCRNTACAET